MIANALTDTGSGPISRLPIIDSQRTRTAFPVTNH
jgi:hypothetical protein